MQKLYLALAFHNHQPVGNFDWVFEKAYQKAYLPMLEALERHPTVRVAVHNSGPLLDWLHLEHPDYVNRLRALAQKGQVEVMAGAYYEPILVSLPDADKAGQLEKMVMAVKTDFDYTATGAWLAERVWEPHLPMALANAGIQYIIVDDTHLKYAGIPDSEQFGYYITEEQGYPLKLFASNKYLRYNIPWAPVADVIAGLRQMAQATPPHQPPRVAVMGDDGEKFGLWPHTYDHCWGDGNWIEQFFTALEVNSNWLKTTLPGEYASKYGALGQVFVTAASYDEMTEWALPAKMSAGIIRIKEELHHHKRSDILQFVKGGLWRGFIAKYAEVNQMHKKALSVSQKVHAMPDSPAKTEALAHLWQAQCNCAYWHGLFGGIYLFHIRGANYRHLINAERIAEQAQLGTDWVSATLTDFDVDGAEELILSNAVQWLCFDLQRGGMLVEWDFRLAPYNLLNTISRYPEAYHQTLTQAAKKGHILLANEDDELQNAHERGVLVKELGLEKRIFYDWYRRGALIDRFFSPELTLDDFVQLPPQEVDALVNQPYSAQIEEGADGVTAVLQCTGLLDLTKRVQLNAGNAQLGVTYQLHNSSTQPIHTRFGVENNFGLEGGQDPLTFFEGLADSAGNQQFPANAGISQNISQFALVSQISTVHTRIEVDCSMPATVWFYPFETITNSEGGYEANYQGSAVMLHWDVKMPAKSSWQLTIQFNLSA